MKRESVHTLISFAFPLFFVLSVSQVFNTFFTISINAALMALVFFITGVEAVFSAKIRSKKEIDSPSSIFREFIIVLPVLLLLVYLVSGKLFIKSKTIAPESFIFYGILLMAQWSLSFRFQKKLIDREKLFDPANKGKKDLLNMYFAIAHKSLKDLKKQHFFCLGVFLVMYLFISLWSKSIPFSISVLFFVFMVIWLSFLIILYRYGYEEQLCLSGLAPKAVRSVTVITLAFLIIFVSVLSFLFAHKVTILSIEPVVDAIRKFFLFLGSLIHEKKIENPPEELPELEPAIRNNPNFQELPDEYNPVWILISRATGVLFLILPIAVIVILFFWPLLKNLFSRKRVISKGLYSFYSNLISFIRDIIFSFRKKKSKESSGFSSLYSFYPKQRKEKKGKVPKKKEPVDPVLKGYQDILTWGKALGYSVDMSLGPEEHLIQYAEKIPEKRKFLVSSSEFIEKYFYSGFAATKTEIKEFLKNIKRETRTTLVSQERKK